MHVDEKLVDRATACLLGGAYGDAMGAGIEFLNTEQIQKKYPGGVREPTGFPGQSKYSITDDTQQTIAVCRGIVHGKRRINTPGAVIDDVWSALKEWCRIQSRDPFERRAPGETSMTALEEEHPGSRQDPPNNSRSCGAVMRAHPIGLFHHASATRSFKLGMRVGVLTHGHPDGYGSAAALSAMITFLIQDLCFKRAVLATIELLKKELPDAKRTIELLTLAMALDPMTNPMDMGVGAEGWSGDEALAMAVFAVRKYPESFIDAVARAVNHSGDSDSVGSIAGALMGAMHGTSILPPDVAQIEHADELRQRAKEITAS